MSATVNLVMTTFGFLVSAIFIVFVLVRLLCARLQTRRFVSDWTLGSAVLSVTSGERGVHGLNPLLITLFPTIKFSDEVFASREDATCAVCLGEYEDRQALRILPQCGHAFHVACIDAWLRQQSTCPVCRIHLQNSPLRKNMPSPLISEAARSRFSPGALPESLFEQRLLDSSSPASEPTSLHQGFQTDCEQGMRICQMHETKQGSEVSMDMGASTSSSQDLHSECIEKRIERCNDKNACSVTTVPGSGNLNQLTSGKYIWRRWKKEEQDLETRNDRLAEGEFGGSSFDVYRCSSVMNAELVSLAREADNKGLWSKPRESQDNSVTGGLRDCDTDDRTSFSLWVHEGSMPECSTETSGKDLGIDNRPDDSILGWTSLAQEYSESRCKVDGREINSFTDVEKG